MKNRISFLLLIFITSLISCSQELKESRISGIIMNPTESAIQIGNQTVPIAEDGKFTYTKVIESPIVLDVSYANLDWTLFLKPECSINVLIREKNIETIEYTGDLASSNTYLLETISMSNEVNSSLNKNWVKFHSQNQADYISTIDSLKGIYLNHLTADSKRYKTFSKEFIKAWKGEINFGFNKLILRYPERHLQYTNNKVKLSLETIHYLKPSEIDNIEYLELPSYKSYAKAFIDYQSELLVEKDTSLMHYSLKKKEAVLSIIPEIFKNQYLKDFWLAEYLKEHIQGNGIVNSKQFLSQFYESCKTEEIKIEIDKYVASEMEIRNDHDILIYKTENGFNLESHIFRPNNISIDEKRPAIVFFHGGGWVSGSPTWGFKYAKHYADLGMIGISGHYRLSNRRDVTPIEAMQDAKDLIIWLRINADSLGIDKNRIVAAGWSAGAHLAASTAVFANTLSNKKFSSSPNALLLRSPALDVANNGWFNQLLNDRDVNPVSLSPVESVFKGLPPTILLQGRDDTLTPLKGVQLFHDKMIENGNYCELWIYDNVGHLFTPSYLDDTGWPKPDMEISKKATKKADEFLKKLGYIVE